MVARLFDDYSEIETFFGRDWSFCWLLRSIDCWWLGKWWTGAALIPIWYTPSLMHILLKTRVLCHLFYDFHIKPIQITPYGLKNPRVLCSLISKVHTPTIKHTCLPPIIHYMLSIIIHMSTRHPIKPCLSGAKPNMKNLPLQLRGS